MKIKYNTDTQTARTLYAAPVCEVVPVWAEGMLCQSGEGEDDDIVSYINGYWS